MRRSGALAGAVVVTALALTGCTGQIAFQPTPGVVPEQAAGRVTVEFSVSGTQDPAICGAHAATELEVVVYDDAGQPVTTAYGPCEGFAVSLDLPEGRYQAQATLVGPDRQPITTTLPLQDLDVVAGTELTVQADFPANSFL
jgi:hypothetical protein